MLPKREKKKTPRNLSSHLLPVIFFTSSYSSNASRYLPDCITLNSPSPFSRRGLPGLFGKQDSIDGLGALPFLRLGFLIKTNYQSNNNELTLPNTIKKIWSSNNDSNNIIRGFRNFYKGFSLAIMRAMPLHGGVFLGYETAKKYL